MRMPTFLVLGVAKSGTTSLYHYLNQHPQVYLPSKKEPHFFAHGEEPLPTFTGPGAANPQKQVIMTLVAYQALFAEWRDEAAVGDLSTTNMLPRACERIQHYIPNARMILLLRQPTERAYSQFLHARRVGLEPLRDFAQALAAEPMRVERGWVPGLFYRPSGFYAPILHRYFAAFPREQIRVYLHEEWQTEPSRVLREIFDFIGVDTQFIPDMSVRHNTAAIPRNQWLIRFLRQPHVAKQWLKPVMPTALRRQGVQWLTAYNRAKAPTLDPQLRAELNELYRQDIVQTQRLLGRDLSHWLH